MRVILLSHAHLSMDCDKYSRLQIVSRYFSMYPRPRRLIRYSVRADQPGTQPPTLFSIAIPRTQWTLGEPREQAMQCYPLQEILFRTGVPISSQLGIQTMPHVVNNREHSTDIQPRRSHHSLMSKYCIVQTPASWCWRHGYTTKQTSSQPPE